MTTATAGSPQPNNSATERAAATLPLPNWLAYTIAVVAVGGALTQPFAIAAGGTSMTESFNNYEFNNVAIAAVLGALILSRHRGHMIGWLLVAAGGGDAVVNITREYRLFGGIFGTDVQDSFNWLWVPSIAALVVALPQLFPNGRLLSRRWRPLLWFGAAGVALLTLVFMVDPISEVPDGLFGLAFMWFTVAGLASLVPLAVRYHRSRGVERQQLKWVFYGLAVFLPISGLDMFTPAGSPTAVLTLIPGPDPGRWTRGYAAS